MPPSPTPHRLLYGPYTAPTLKRGDRTTCLFRDEDVVIIGWSDARIPWPRCRSLATRGGGSGLLVDDELARAVRHESSVAIQHHWGVTEGVVWRWRKALGIGQWEPDGSKQLHQQLSERGAAALKERGLTDEQREERRRQALRLNQGQYITPGYQGPWWSKREVKLLGCHPDEEVARRTGRTVNAVRLKRQKLGIPNPKRRG